MTRNEWITEKIRMSEAFADGACGASYSEAMLVLCSAISSFASEVWQGTRIDQKRFTEILKTFTPATLCATIVSIPFLVNNLNARNMSEGQVIYEHFLASYFGRILVGTDIDKTEDEILKVCNTIPLNILRECSYANLLYTEVRCSYAHEYQPGKRADNWPWTSGTSSPVSYINWGEYPNYHIYFQINWVSSLGAAVAAAIDNLEDRIPLKQPEKWWIGG